MEGFFHSAQLQKKNNVRNITKNVGVFFIIVINSKLLWLGDEPND